MHPVLKLCNYKKQNKNPNYSHNPAKNEACRALPGDAEPRGLLLLSTEGLTQGKVNSL